ncbi:hypothetical protein ES707_07425 [subsurface metagenome]
MSFVGVAPITAANPGAEPSTNSIPLSLIIKSSAAPSQMLFTGLGPIIYFIASIISSAKSVAIPASKALPKYGSHTFSLGIGGNNS